MTAINDIITAMRELVDQKLLAVAEIARYVNIDEATIQDMVDGRFMPAAELTAELEALAGTLREDPSGAFARKLIQQPRSGLHHHDNPRVLSMPQRID